MIVSVTEVVGAVSYMHETSGMYAGTPVFDCTHKFEKTVYSCQGIYISISC